MAGRPRKIVSMQTGDLRKGVRERREYEESLISSSGEDLDDVKTSQFVNTTARKEYDRVLKRLREETGMVGNLNKSDLINYANSYGRYMDMVKECRKKTFTYLIDTDAGPKPNPIIRMMDEARRDMAESSRRLGMTLDGQLKTAKAKADRQEAEMEQKFGVI